MSNAVKLSNYTDFDRLFIPKNFIITLLGSGGAFALAFLPFYIELPLIPYNLLLASAFMIFVAVYSSNIASSILVALIGSLGYTAADGYADFILGYMWVNLLLCVLLGYYADKLQLIMHWTRFYLVFSVLFSLAVIAIGVLTHQYNDLYLALIIPIAEGGDFGTGLDLPVLDLAVLGVILILALILALVLRGQIQLQKDERTKYRLFGGLFFIIGQAATIAYVLLYSVKVPESAMVTILPNASNLSFYTETFFHGPLLGVYGGYLSIYSIMAISTSFTLFGLALLMVGKHGGNLEGRKGKSDIAFLAAPLTFIIFVLSASYPVQNFLAPGGLYLSQEGLIVFAAGLWTTYFIGQLVARVLLFIFRA